MTAAPTGTYRVQLTPEHGFAALAAMADHLQALGVSHVYLSPVLAAAPGSQHGYDVVDHARIDPELGGEAGLLEAATRLREHGIGMVLDIVPNHMAMTVPEYLNRVVWSVLREGPASPHAGWLDVDWAADRPVLLPFLGRRIDQCLDAGEIVLDRAGGPDGEPVVRYFEHVLPVRPGTEHLPLEDLLAAQAYRLAFWRVADEELNYRRFFDIDTLVGLRVEDPAVFAATHAVVLRLLGEGLASGLRIDHPDGLADPRGYLRRLAAAAPPGAWLVVEKILEGDEELPVDWPCAGTTGYDALAAVGAAFVDPDGAPVLTSAFAELAGADETWPEAADEARRDVLRGPLVAEVDRLAQVAHEVCQGELRLRDHSLRGLTEAVFELLAAMPVYRAYVVPGESAPPAAVAVLEAACERAVRSRPERAPETTLLRDLALGRLGRGVRKDEFCVRFQQTTGPAMAKGVEDTAAYRWFPLTSLAEVGSRPDGFGAGAEPLHRYARRRLAAWPDALTASSTHDSKRSEDTRARLTAISEIPAEWVGAVRGWRA
ncbi:MAG: malto-oligosyltrehalose synthase, partial [Actinomycetes bacterium]